MGPARHLVVKGSRCETGPVTRDDWFARLCAELLEALPHGAARALRSVPGLDTPADSPDLGPATLAAEVTRRYAAGEHPDDIAEWLAAAALEPEGEAVTELVVPLCELFRTGGLPFPRWWRPDELAGMLLRRYARARRADIHDEELALELVQRWGLSGEDALEVHANALAEIVEQPGIFIEPGHDPASRWLRKIAGMKDFRTKVEAALTSCPPALHERDDLVAMARYLATSNAIAERLNDTSGWRDPVVDVAVDQLNEALEAAGEVLLSLSPYERSLVEPVSEVEALFARAMDVRRNTVFLGDAGGANALPDRVLGEWRVTQWLANYVYLQGGRIQRRSAGPMAYWALVLEEADEGAAIAELLADPDWMPGGGLVKTDALASFRLEFADDPSDPLLLEFTYGDNPEALLDLVTLVQARRVRLDVFAIRDGALVGVGTRSLPIANEAIGAFLEPMVAKVAALLDDQERAEHARLGLDRADVWASFLAADAAKSADLLAGLDPALIVGVRKLDAEGRESYREARRALLSARVAGSGIEEARRHYAQTVERLRRPSGQGPAAVGRGARADVKRLVDGLVDDRRAVLALTLGRDPLEGSTRLGGFWVAGAGRRRAAGDVTVDSRSLEALREAVPLPLTEPSDLDATIYAAPSLGRELVAPLIERGVRELTILPVSFLHALPLHLWPATDDPRGDRLVDAFDLVSYAPSASLLRGLAAAPPPTQGSVVAAGHGADLRFVGAELGVLTSLTAGRARALPDATTTAVTAAAAAAGLLHLACHGTWIIGDYWSSGLALAEADGLDGWLSVAEIQRDLDLTATELVCLSACDSGVSATDLWRIDDYLGIDGAFLACGARAVLSTLWAVTDAVALLFTATVYHALAGGETLAAAYRAAVSTFATGAYRDVDASHPVGAVLAEAGVDWQAEVRELDEMDVDLGHPFYWGVFKLSGLVGGQVYALMNPA